MKETPRQQEESEDRIRQSQEQEASGKESIGKNMRGSLGHAAKVRRAEQLNSPRYNLRQESPLSCLLGWTTLKSWATSKR